MASHQQLGGPSRCGRVVGPSLDKIIKNVAWRKHSQLVSACKSSLDRLDSLSDLANADVSSPIPSLPRSDAETVVLTPLLLAFLTSSPKVIEPALDCLFKLFSLNIVVSEIHFSEPSSGSASPTGNGYSANGESGPIVARIMEYVCKLCSLQEEAVELGVLRVLLSAVRSPCLVIRGEFLIHIVKTCYNVYLGGMGGTNQICAKAVLAQIMAIVFARVEDNSMIVEVKTVLVGELLEFVDRHLSEGNSVQLVQSFMYEVMEGGERVKDMKHFYPLVMHAGDTGLENGDDVWDRADEKDETGDGEDDGKQEMASESKIRADGFMLFKNLCKLSMKFSSQEHSDDKILLKGKILSLELLKTIMDNGGSIWRTNERFLNIIKQFLCLSLLKNSALSVMTIFQLLCYIFKSLLYKYRSGLKAEIGIFFPMLILRVLENVLQPSFLQKMTVLNLLEKISQDPQLVVDIFVNYDCDLDAPNIYERTVNSLLKTAMGPPPGSTTTLTPAQDLTFRQESVKCLVNIVKSMGLWMDQQLKVVDAYVPSKGQGEISAESPTSPNLEEGAFTDFEPEANPEMSNAVTLEQRRAYKLEVQKGISVFNRKPSKGIEFLIKTRKVGGTPEDIASFLKNAIGLSPGMIGNYLGDREDFPLKVMHAYVDSYDFEKMDFGEAIRFFLQGFRLPGEAQKIDRIMEKFAERYCKCNPDSFARADTAYVLAYSVIMLNTDAHNSMVKGKMTKADFIRNNRGIDNGKDLPEEYLGALYDQIVKDEIKMNADYSEPQNKQVNSLKLLGLDGILNLVTGKQVEEKPLGANGLLIKHIQDKFKAKSGKSESVFYSTTNVAILRFMVEVCWGPMLAAFSVTLDRSHDKLATSQCLQGFRFAIHVTAVMGMQTQRDAFVTSIAKFTYLHCAADMKQKNIDAMKAIMTIAIEDGNNLQEAWEHIITCLSRFEHLQLLGEGAPPDASFLNSSNAETEEKPLKSSNRNSLKKKGALQNPAVMAVVRGGSYDSSSLGAKAPKLVAPEQVNNFILNLYLLDQIGSYELNHIFAHSQRLNSEAIVSFVRALCKVAISELQSPNDPRVFCLTKIVEIAHYNMNRIRLVWSRIWNVLSDFFVSVGLSQNLSVAIFVMDSLRQLAVKFLEREELANYNFQNDFLRPFVVVMQKSNTAEIRELIVRCISQMVLSRVRNVKSGWKSVFLVFTAAAADERKSIVLLAFETMEKIVREYFPYITETETTTFTDCVHCLLTFTNSRFDSDVSLNAIAFLRYCAVKLAEGGLISNEDSNDDIAGGDRGSDNQTSINKDENASFWMPLLTGLSKLTSDPRSPIRNSSLEVLFNILKDHGRSFSWHFWTGVSESVVFPMFTNVHDKNNEITNNNEDLSPNVSNPSPDSCMWDNETSKSASDCLVDLFLCFFSILRPLLPSVVSILAAYIKSPDQSLCKTGVSAFEYFTDELGDHLMEDDWRGILLALKEAAVSSLPEFSKFMEKAESLRIPDPGQSYEDLEFSSGEDVHTDMEEADLQTAALVIKRMKAHISTQLVLIQVTSDLCKNHMDSFTPPNILILLDLFSSLSAQANQLSSNPTARFKLKKASIILDLAIPPIITFEIESIQNHLSFLQDLLLERPSVSADISLEPRLVSACETVLHLYLRCYGSRPAKQTPHWILPLGSFRKEDLAVRTPLLLSALRALKSLRGSAFRKHALRLFPLLVGLVKSEHSSGDVTRILRDIFGSCIGPIAMQG